MVYIKELGKTVNKELQLESHPCDCSTIEGESELSTSRNKGVIQWYLGYCNKSILYQPTYLLLYTGAMMQDLTVDQHSTWMDQHSTTCTEAPQ